MSLLSAGKTDVLAPLSILIFSAFTSSGVTVVDGAKVSTFIVSIHLVSDHWQKACASISALAPKLST